MDESERRIVEWLRSEADRAITLAANPNTNWTDKDRLAASAGADALDAIAGAIECGEHREKQHG